MASDIPDGGTPVEKGYLLRHWRGELELTQSFWVNYAIFYVFIASTGLGLLQSIGFTSFRTLVMVLVAWAFVQMAAFVWMAVGSWRAAENWIRRTGRRVWAWAARGVLILHCGLFLYFMVPNIITYVPIAASFDPFNKFRITRTGSNLVLVQGLIGANLPGELSDVLEASPEVDWIRLESVGGRLGPARQLGIRIIDLGLKVMVWDECSSACFLAFMAADVRAISPKTRIGLHAYLMPRGIGFLADSEMDFDRQFLTKRGVSRAFLDKAFSTPPDDMWYPSFDELVEAGVVTHVMENGKIRPVRPQ